MTRDQNRVEARRWFGQAEDDLEFARLGLEEEFYAAGDDAVRLSELETRGILRRGRGRITSDLWACRPRTEADAIAVLLGERSDGQ